MIDILDKVDLPNLLLFLTNELHKTTRKDTIRKLNFNCINATSKLKNYDFYYNLSTDNLLQTRLIEFLNSNSFLYDTVKTLHSKY